MSNRKDDMIAVAIDKDKSSQFALKWAADHLLGKGRRVTLVHVKAKSSSSTGDLSHDATSKAGRSQNDPQIKDVVLPFRCFCTRKNLQVNEVVVEDSDVVRGLCNFVKTNLIENLVVGSSPKPGFTMKFKTVDIPGGVTKAAPDFCTVYVINKGKIATVRTATGVPPALPPRQAAQHQTHSAPTLVSSRISGNSSASFSPFASSYTASRSQMSDTIKSPFSRESSNLNYTTSDFLDSDISFVRSTRPSMDNMFQSTSSDNQDDVIIHPCRLSSSSDTDNLSSFNTAFSLNQNNNSTFSSSSQESGGGRSWSSANSQDEVEVEMRRLKLELKQTMDTYNTACKEAELKKHKAEEQEEIEEARSAEDLALAIIEKEKLKSKAAIEAAQAAQRLAELEAQKRKNVERKAFKEKREKKKMLDVISNNDVRYRRYSIEELEDATNDFSLENKIGEGGYGPVYKCNLDHTPVAVKVLRPDAAQGQSQFQQEVEVLSTMRHPNMVLLLGACPEYGCLIYEYMSNGSLDDCLFNRGDKPSLPWQLRFRIAAEIATGLLFLHQAKPEPLVHRDLKPGNILLDRNYVSKISDVGLARLVPPSVADNVTQYRMTSTAGTFCYIDPEYQQTGMLGTKSDIYSLGVLLLQIITAKSPMGLTHHVERAIKKGNFAEMLDPSVPDWPVEEALSFAKLALRCVELRRKDRPDLGQLLPELNRLRALGEETMPHMMPCFGSKLSS